MMNNVYGFTPKNTPKQQRDKKAIYFEDAKSDIAPGLWTKKSESTIKGEIADIIAAMGGSRVKFSEGDFGPNREGFMISFRIQNQNEEFMNCREPVAAFPCREAKNKEQARRQALFAFREYLHAEYSALHFRPGYNPFVMHIVNEDGHTLAEAVAERYMLPGG